MTNEPQVYYMLPMFGVPYFEIIGASESFDVEAMLRDSMADAQAKADAIRCRGTRSLNARYKADYLTKVDLIANALRSMDGRVVREGSKVTINLLRTMPSAARAV